MTSKFICSLSLQDNTGDALNTANATLASLTGTLSSVNDSFHTLSDVKELVQSVLDITIPSLEYAAMLASQIEENALPQDVIDEIVQNATESRAEAERALNTIRNARLASITNMNHYYCAMFT